jgi:DHA2 family methylenomycin A resistance protein-like MFS transporter
VALAAVTVAELRRGEDALLPPALLGQPASGAANAIAGIMNLCTLGTPFVLMLFLQTVQHRSTLLAGLAVVPLFTPLVILAPLDGRVTCRAGSRLPAVAGLLTAAAGLALLARADAQPYCPPCCRRSCCGASASVC